MSNYHTVTNTPDFGTPDADYTPTTATPNTDWVNNIDLTEVK